MDVKKCTHLNLNIRPDQHAPSVEDALHIILALPIPHPRASCIGTKIAQAKKAASTLDLSVATLNSLQGVDSISNQAEQGFTCLAHRGQHQQIVSKQGARHTELTTCMYPTMQQVCKLFLQLYTFKYSRTYKQAQHHQTCCRCNKDRQL
eukprot:1157801-Pelagomonas_calceolata.AAC.4